MQLGKKAESILVPRDRVTKKLTWIGYGRWRSTTQWTLRFFLTERSERASHVAKNEYPVNIMKHLSLITVALLVSFSTKGSRDKL